MKLDADSYNDAIQTLSRSSSRIVFVSGDPSVAKCQLRLQRRRVRQQVVYARQDAMARSNSGPKSPENIATSIPAPRTTAINLSAIIFESAIDFWREARTVLFPQCFVVSVK
jgi:hypothetical protein